MLYLDKEFKNTNRVYLSDVRNLVRVADDIVYYSNNPNEFVRMCYGFRRRARAYDDAAGFTRKRGGNFLDRLTYNDEIISGHEQYEHLVEGYLNSFMEKPEDYVINEREGINFLRALKEQSDIFFYMRDSTVDNGQMLDMLLSGMTASMGKNRENAPDMLRINHILTLHIKAGYGVLLGGRGKYLVYDSVLENNYSPQQVAQDKRIVAEKCMGQPMVPTADEIDDPGRCFDRLVRYGCISLVRESDRKLKVFQSAIEKFVVEFEQPDGFLDHADIDTLRSMERILDNEFISSTDVLTTAPDGNNDLSAMIAVYHSGNTFNRSRFYSALEKKLDKIG